MLDVNHVWLLLLGAMLFSRETTQNLGRQSEDMSLPMCPWNGEAVAASSPPCREIDPTIFGDEPPHLVKTSFSQKAVDSVFCRRNVQTLPKAAISNVWSCLQLQHNRYRPIVTQMAGLAVYQGQPKFRNCRRMSRR